MDLRPHLLACDPHPLAGEDPLHAWVGHPKEISRVSEYVCGSVLDDGERKERLGWFEGDWFGEGKRLG